ncbi:MAG: hypothetical protein OSB36_05365 [Longimicrobiales bacterium]|nr:hypothetical protein [Longimicrobiales bacterium]
MPVQDTEEALESVRETVTVQEGSSMEGVILIVGIAVSYYLAKLGKTAVQGVAIWMVTMGAVFFAMWQFD